MLKSVSNNTQREKQIETLNFQTDMYVLLPTQFRCVSSCCPSSVAVEPSGKQRSKSWDCQKKRLRDCSRSVFFKVLEAIVERYIFLFFVNSLFLSYFFPQIPSFIFVALPHLPFIVFKLICTSYNWSFCFFSEKN